MQQEFEAIYKKLKKGELKFIGNGSCRRVFDLGNGYVIKVAKDIRGVFQNKAEYSIFHNCKSDFFAELLSISDDGRSLIMAKAQKIRHIKSVYDYYKVKGNNNLLRQNYLSEDIKNNNIGRGDLRRAANWGLINGRPVIIDYGLTKEIYKRFYSNRLFSIRKFKKLPPIKVSR